MCIQSFPGSDSLCVSAVSCGVLQAARWASRCRDGLNLNSPRIPPWNHVGSTLRQNLGSADVISNWACKSDKSHSDRQQEKKKGVLKDECRVCQEFTVNNLKWNHPRFSSPGPGTGMSVWLHVSCRGGLTQPGPAQWWTWSCCMLPLKTAQRRQRQLPHKVGQTR